MCVHDEIHSIIHLTIEENKQTSSKEVLAYTLHYLAPRIYLLYSIIANINNITNIRIHTNCDECSSWCVNQICEFDA